MRSIWLGCLLWAASRQAAAEPLMLSSPDIRAGAALSLAQVGDKGGCKGSNLSPQLQWKGAPAGTRSFAITFYDRDAPTGSGWWHWVVFNIPAEVHALPAGAGDVTRGLLPPGAVQGRTDFGRPGFGGACPPIGAKPHRYIFTLHALDTDRIEAPPDASAAYVGYQLHLHELGRARLEARYGRP